MTKSDLSFSSKTIFLFLIFLTHSTRGFALDLATYNIRNFNYDERYKIETNTDKLKDILGTIDADLISVQEIKNKEAFEDFIKSNFSNFGIALSDCGGKGGQKLGFLYRKSKIKLIKSYEDFSSNIGVKDQCNNGVRPFFVAEFKYETKNLRFDFIGISVHLKAGGNDRSINKRYLQLDRLNELVKELRKKTQNIVAMGDYNSTEFIFGDQLKDRFLASLQNSSMIDIYNDDGCSSYWWGGIDDGIEKPSILDHITVSKELKDKLNYKSSKALAHCASLSCKDAKTNDLGISYAEVSDHCPIVAKGK